MSRYSSQLPLHFRSWGGRRPGAGRPKSKHAGVSHTKRPAFAARYPIHVTLKVRRDVGKLRSKRGYGAVRQAFVAACSGGGFRVCHYSVQTDHIHMVVEAKDQTRILKTPREVKNALNYVLNNGLRHKPVRDGDFYLLEEDVFSSAEWFDGWRTRANPRCLPTGPPPVSKPKTWLLTVGWRRHGLLVPTYIPPRRSRAKRAKKTR